MEVKTVVSRDIANLVAKLPMTYIQVLVLNNTIAGSYYSSVNKPLIDTLIEMIEVI